jgi:hypothetical protein
LRNFDIPEEEFQVQYCGFELEKSMESETLKNIKCYIIVKIVKYYIIGVFPPYHPLGISVG